MGGTLAAILRTGVLPLLLTGLLAHELWRWVRGESRTGPFWGEDPWAWGSLPFYLAVALGVPGGPAPWQGDGPTLLALLLAGDLVLWALLGHRDPLAALAAVRRWGTSLAAAFPAFLIALAGLTLARSPQLVAFAQLTSVRAWGLRLLLVLALIPALAARLEAGRYFNPRLLDPVLGALPLPPRPLLWFRWGGWIVLTATLLLPWGGDLRLWALGGLLGGATAGALLGAWERREGGLPMVRVLRLFGSPRWGIPLALFLWWWVR